MGVQALPPGSEQMEKVKTQGSQFLPGKGLPAYFLAAAQGLDF